MSKRRWKGRAANIVVSSDEEEEAEEVDLSRPPPARRQKRAEPSAAPRRGALQLSQSTAASSGGTATRNALEVLLAGSQGAAAAAANGSRPSGAGAASGKVASGKGAAAAAAAAKPPPASRRGGRATHQQKLQLPPAASGASSQGTAAAAAAAAGATQPSQPSGTAGASGKASAGAIAAAAAAAKAVPPGRGALWVERYAPASEAELAVHKKKVQEVRLWLEEQRRTLGQPGVPRLLVVSGPPGCGKSSVLRVLAAAAGFDVSEWRPPTALQWDEAEYARMQKKSKLDDFAEFVARSKLPHLSLRSTGSSSGAGSSAIACPASGSNPAAGGVGGASQLQQQQQQEGTPGSQGAAGSQQRAGRLPPSLLPTLTIVDDLPHAAGPEQRRQIAEALADLAGGARFPVVVVATEASGKAQQEKGLSAAAGSIHGMHKDLVAVLESFHATTISFNPFTPLNITKALKLVLQKEQRALPDADVAAIAEQSNGDLFNAISTLQFVCTGAAAAPAPAVRGGKGKAGGGKRKAAGLAAAAGAKAGGGGGKEGEKARVGFASRDDSLSLFHALGKLLYNKRLEAGAAAGSSGSPGSGGSSQQQPAAGSLAPQQQQEQQQQGASGSGSQAPGASTDGSSLLQRLMAAAGLAAAGGGAMRPPGPPLQLAAWAQRKPMEFDPEAVLAGAGLDAVSVAAFLHENLPHFVDDSAVADMAGCLEQLSAADCLASGRRWGTDDSMADDDPSPSSTLLDALAASTAARGVCFCNAHPAPRRWLPLKAPSAFSAGRGMAANRQEMCQQTAPTWATAGGLCSLEPAGRLAAELLPYARAIAARCPNPGALQRLQPAKWSRFWNGQLYEERPGGAGARAGGWGQAGGVGRDAELAGAEVAPAGASEDLIEESDDENDW